MTDKVLPSTLREMYRRLSRKPTIIAFIAVLIISTIAGPFSTFEKLDLLPRFAYWGVVIAGCFILAIGVQVLAERLFAGGSSSRKAWAARLAIRALVPGILIGLFVYFLNQLVWGDIPTLPRLESYLAMTIPISGVVTLIVEFWPRKHPGGDDHSMAQADVPIKFLERLPRHLGTQLLSLSATDHYVEAETAKGKHLVLMRFGDALGELAPLPGIRIHRSYWVAENAIKTVRKNNGKLEVVLRNGNALPVSRGRQAEVKAFLKL